MTWPTLNSFASHLSMMTLRPPMPPAALHHLLNPSAVSKNSCSRPGAAAAPGSAVTPIRMVVLVRPRVVGPEGLPGPQMALSDPKSPAAAAVAVGAALDAPLDGVPDEPPLERPHAESERASTAPMATGVATEARGPRRPVSRADARRVGRRGICNLQIRRETDETHACAWSVIADNLVAWITPYDAAHTVRDQFVTQFQSWPSAGSNSRTAFSDGESGHRSADHLRVNPDCVPCFR